MDLTVRLIRHQHLSRESIFLQEMNRTRMIPVRMRHEKIIRAADLLQRQIRHPVHAIRRSSRVHQESMPLPLDIEAVPALIADTASNIKAHMFLRL